MQRGGTIGLGILLLALAGCRTDGNRGQAQERRASPEGASDRGTSGVNEQARAPADAASDATARVLAAARSLAQAQIDAARLAQQHAAAPEVKEYATRTLAELSANVQAIGDTAKAKSLDLDGAQNDPLARAERSGARAALDRLGGLDGQAFDAAYLASERSGAARLASLAQEGQSTSKDTDVGNVLRGIGQQARERDRRATAILPRACGGEAAGWGGGGTPPAG
jgi:predicted outer membrane protein